MDARPAKITPCLWFDVNTEKAVNHYLGIFKRRRILATSRLDAAMPEHAGKVAMKLDIAALQPLRRALSERTPTTLSKENPA